MLHCVFPHKLFITFSDLFSKLSQKQQFVLKTIKTVYKFILVFTTKQTFYEINIFSYLRNNFCSEHIFKHNKFFLTDLRLVSMHMQCLSLSQYTFSANFLIDKIWQIVKYFTKCINCGEPLLNGQVTMSHMHRHGSKDLCQLQGNYFHVLTSTVWTLP